MTRTNGTYDGFGRPHRWLVCGAALSGALALTVSLAPALASEPTTGEPTVPAVATQPAATTLPATQEQPEADQTSDAEPAPDGVTPAPEAAPTEPTGAAEPEMPVEPAPPTEPAPPAEPAADAAEKPAWLQGENLHISASPVWVGDSVYAGETVTISVTLDADDPAELPALADVSLPGSAGLEPTGPITQDGATFSREFLVTEDVPISSYLEISVLINETATHAESTALDITTLRRAQLADYTDFFAVRNSIDDDRLLLDYQSPDADELLEFVTSLDSDAVLLHLPVEHQDVVDLYTWTLQYYIDELVPKTHVTLTVMTPSTNGVGPGGVLEVFVDVKGLNDVEELPPAEGNIVILAAIDEENPLPYADDSGGPVRVTYPESGMAGYLAKFRVPDDAPLGSTIEIEAAMLGNTHTSDGIATATAVIALADVSAL